MKINEISATGNPRRRIRMKRLRLMLLAGSGTLVVIYGMSDQPFGESEAKIKGKS